MGIVQMENQELGYGNQKVLSQVTFQIESGEFVFVCGPTGGGKSTLLRKIKEQLGLRAAFATQNPNHGLVCDYVDMELAFNLETQGAEDELIRARVAECAGFFGISKWMERQVATLSGGEKQILNLATAMTMNPEVLILDEPTAMLDPIMTDRVMDTVYKLNREFGITVIISEHKAEQVFEKATKVLYVADGTVQCMDRDEMARYFLKDSKRRGYTPMITRMFANQELPVYSVADGKQILAKGGTVFESFESMFFQEGEENTVEGESLVLDMKHVTFGYEKFAPILKDVNLQLHKGEIISLLGENGCGKSTLALLVAGGKKPFSGKIKAESCGMLFQNVEVHFLKDEYNGKHPYDYSGGERQKLAMSLVLEKQPKMLILDEPSKGLDPMERENLKEQMRTLARDGMGILLITHDVELAAEISNRMLLMHGGRIVKNQSAEKFVKENIFYTLPCWKVSCNRDVDVGG